MSQNHDSQARTLVVLLGVASAAVVAFAAMQAGSHGGLGSFIVLLVAAVLFECASVPLRGHGYVSLAFFVYLTAIARPSTLYSAGRLPAGGDAISIVSQAILMAFFAMVVGWIFRFAVLGDKQSAWSRATDFFVNLLRIATIGMVYLHLPGIQRTADGAATLQVFGLANVAGLLLTVGIYYGFDRLLSGTAVLLLEGEDEQRKWLRVHSHSGLLTAVVLACSAYLAIWVGLGAFEELRSASPVLPLALGLVAGGVPALVLNRAVGATVRDMELEDQVVLEAALKGARNQIETLRQREDNLSREVQKKTGDLDMLFGMARDLGAATNLQDTLEIVLGMIRQMGIRYQSCVVFLLQDGHAMPARSVTPFKEVLEMSHLLQLEESHVSQVLRTGRPVLAAEVRSSSEQRIFKDEHSVVCAPLIVSKEAIGAIYMGAREPGTYTEDDRNTLTMLAAHAAPSIHTARLFEDKEKDLERERQQREEVEAKNQQLSGLQKMVQAIGRELKQDHSLDVVIETVKELIPDAQSIIVFLAEGEGESQQYVPVRFQTPYEGMMDMMSVRKGEGLVGKAIEHASMLVVNDVREYNHHNILIKELSVIAAPLVTENETMGCLYLGATKEDTFSEEAQSLAATISFQAALAIKNSRLMDQMSRMALTDGLTGLYTHRFFQEQLKVEVESAKRTGEPLCLVLVDTDKFKQYNDNLGHPAGDALLQQIASILREAVRSSDIVCRQGGDEFALIMKGSPKTKAVETAEKIRQQFQIRFSTHQVQVTASIGVACYPTDARSKQELAEVADQALYKSKNTGRNRVSIAPSLDEIVTPVA